jgi:hypothetical protein
LLRRWSKLAHPGLSFGSELSTVKALLRSLVAPLLVALLTPAATAVGSRLTSGSWVTWFLFVPVWVWPTACVAFLGWMLVILVRRRRQQMALRMLYPRLDGGGAWGKKVLGDLDYAGVRWRAYTTEWHELVMDEDISPDNVHVEQVPRCPRCATEMGERARFWGGFDWSCCRCHFHVRASSTFGTVSIDAGRVARSMWEDRLRRPRP